ncbi:MAG TPA: helix-turn-helix domain-containing protein [Solirubrobacterales bacterium]
MEDGVGNKLREARTRRKLTLADIEAATKIRGRYLLAIENEDWDQLPGDTYARAFVRTYGSLLGLDGERLAEEQRRQRGGARPGERLPRVDPRPRRVMRRRRSESRAPSGLAAALVTALVVAALIVVGLSAGDSGDSGPETEAKPPVQRENARTNEKPAKPAVKGHTLRLLANGEVWVCLLGGSGRPLVAGDILAPGESAGPFRSGSFTVALGNGAVTMTVDGKQQSLAEPPSPIGFAVDSRGAVSELPEGERPTCT